MRRNARLGLGGSNLALGASFDRRLEGRSRPFAVLPDQLGRCGEHQKPGVSATSRMRQVLPFRSRPVDAQVRPFEDFDLDPRTVGSLAAYGVVGVSPLPQLSLSRVVEKVPSFGRPLSV